MSDSDVLTFLLSFERVCESNNIPSDLWARLLTPQLTPQASKVILRLTNEEAKSYDSMKRAILSYYRLSAQRYLKEFRSMKRSGRDTYAMTLNKLRDMQMAYFEARQIRTFEDLSDAFLMEQLINTLPNDVRSFVWSKEPKNAQDCAREADLFFDVSKINQTIPKYTFWSRDDARNSGGHEGNFTHLTNGFNRNPGARTPGPVRPPANNFRPVQPNTQFARQKERRRPTTI